VAIKIYAIDYTLSQTDRTPIKVDFLDLQKVTESYFKDYMLNAYVVSTQATLVDFTTSFVTAHFKPDEPVHIQYNSTAFFTEDSINVPTSENIFSVLEKSLENPESYIGKLKSQLSDVNPFSSTENTIFTKPEDASVIRSSTTRARSMFGIAGAGAVVILALGTVAGIVFCREAKHVDSNAYGETVTKQNHGDVTVAGETYVSESINSTYDSNCSIGPPTREIGHIEIRHTKSSRSSTRERTQNATRASNGIRDPITRPRTVAEIESLLSLGNDGII